MPMQAGKGPRQVGATKTTRDQAWWQLQPDASRNQPGAIQQQPRQRVDQKLPHKIPQKIADTTLVDSLGVREPMVQIQSNATT